MKNSFENMRFAEEMRFEQNDRQEELQLGLRLIDEDIVERPQQGWQPGLYEAVYQQVVDIELETKTIEKDFIKH